MGSQSSKQAGIHLLLLTYSSTRVQTLQSKYIYIPFEINIILENPTIILEKFHQILTIEFSLMSVWNFVIKIFQYPSKILETFKPAPNRTQEPAFLLFSWGMTMATSGTTGCTMRHPHSTTGMATLRRHSLTQACTPPLPMARTPSSGTSNRSTEEQGFTSRSSKKWRRTRTRSRCSSR